MVIACTSYKFAFVGPGVVHLIDAAVHALDAAGDQTLYKSLAQMLAQSLWSLLIPTLHPQPQ